MSIKQRLYPTTEQETVLHMHADHARFIYNLSQEARLLWRKGKPSQNYYDHAKQLTELRNDSEYSWLKQGSSLIQQQALKDCEQAWKNYYQNPQHFKKPSRFRSVKHHTQSFRIVGLKDASFKRINKKWAEINIPKAGWTRFRISRSWYDIKQSKSARITLKNNQWHISFTAEQPEFNRESTGAVVGADRGVRVSLATSDGEMLKLPSRLNSYEQARFNALTKLLAKQWGPANLEFRRKQKESEQHISPSNRYKQTKAKLAELHDRGSRRAKDAVEKITTRLVHDYDLIAVEDLRVKNMTKRPNPKEDPENAGHYLPNNAAAKAGLNKSILANSWGLMLQRLRDKAIATPENHKTIIKLINPKGTSRECLECHYVSPENRESQAVFKCMKCAYSANADVNAAGVILYRALNNDNNRSSADLNSGYAVGHTVKGQTPVSFDTVMSTTRHALV